MARKTAGKRYPHATTAARAHDHAYCPVVGIIAQRVADGIEDWGTPHALPALPSEDQAVKARQGLFRGRACGQLSKAHGQLSVSVMYRSDDGALSNSPVAGPDGYVLVVRVWSRSIAKQEITRRVNAGESLHYNALRGSV